MAEREPISAPERSRRTLAGGVLVFRWVALAWMTTIAATGSEPLRHPVIAWASVGAAGGWTVWLTFSRNKWIDAVLWADLALCLWLLLASGIVVTEGDIISQRPFFATGYPLSAALLWGVSRGPVGGIFAGAVLGLGLVLARPLNGVPLTALSGREIQNLAGAVLNYLVAGGAVGLVSRLLVTSATALQGATEELVRERERAARLAERESLARQIHDSVLQALALVHKSGRELSTKQVIPGEEVARLGEMAGQQEAELRSLILRSPVEAGTGTKSLRQELEASARSLDGLYATVSSVGPIFLDAASADEITAAVRQSLENVLAHARASHATVFAEDENGEVVVTVRDDGVGFVYDEEALRREGKVGMLKSMKGRIEDLGGSMKVTTAPGRGTEIELRVPRGVRDQT